MKIKPWRWVKLLDNPNVDGNWRKCFRDGTYTIANQELCRVIIDPFPFSTFNLSTTSVLALGMRRDMSLSISTGNLIAVPYCFKEGWVEMLVINNDTTELNDDNIFPARVFVTDRKIKLFGPAW